jgi:hypothetical protein
VPAAIEDIFNCLSFFIVSSSTTTTVDCCDDVHGIELELELVMVTDSVWHVELVITTASF